MSQINTDIQLLETLAFSLFFSSDADEKSMTIWRDPSSKELREKWRSEAKSLIDSLNEVGVKVSIGSASRVGSFIKTLMTQPAVMTYSLLSET